MEFEELKARYTELRERCIELQKLEYETRMKWNEALGMDEDKEFSEIVLRSVFRDVDEFFNRKFPPIK